MQEFEEQWQRWSQDMINGLQKWLQTHPQASVQEIELILDERLNRLRTQIMRDVALAIAKVKGFEMASKEQPRCHNCGIILTSLEKYQWRSQSTGGEEMDVEMHYGNGTCPGCGAKLLP